MYFKNCFLNLLIEYLKFVMIMYDFFFEYLRCIIYVIIKVILYF